MVFSFSQMKHSQLPMEGIEGRACKDPDCTNSTLGIPSLVSQLALPPQLHAGGSHPDKMLHPAPGTCPSCSCSRRPPALQSHASPQTRCRGGGSASLSIRDCASSSVTIHFFPVSLSQKPFPSIAPVPQTPLSR